MIQVRLKLNQNHEIMAFTVSGHANSAPHGEDLVCAGVSAVTFGTINAIYALVTKDIIVKQKDSGFISCKLPMNLSNEGFQKVQLLLESMIIMLKQMEQTNERQYIEFIDEV